MPDSHRCCALSRDQHPEKSPQKRTRLTPALRHAETHDIPGQTLLLLTPYEYRILVVIGITG